MNRKSLFSIVALLVLWMSGLVSYAQVNNDAHRCPMKEDNNIFRPVGIGIFDFHIAIFDRQGHQIYEYSGFENGWDGRNSAGADSPMGAYVYVATWRNVLYPDNVESKKGTVTLIR